MRRRRLLFLFSILSLLATFSPLCAQDQDRSYISPYRLEFKIPMAELLAPDQIPPRQSEKLESSIPFEEWNSRRVRREFGSWGPGQRHYPALPNESQLSPEWKRERVLAVAANLIGLSYQHHHIPDWLPEETGQGKPCKKGLDCSNFSAWVYNYGLGIKPNSAIEKQASQTEIASADGSYTTKVERIENDGDYASLVKKLKTGDLLFIRGKNKNRVTHVIMWVGDCGRSPDGVPLIIDCTGPEHRDSNGNTIPGGVRLRPFLKDSWYYKCFDHAHRLIHD